MNYLKEANVPLKGKVFRGRFLARKYIPSFESVLVVRQVKTIENAIFEGRRHQISIQQLLSYVCHDVKDFY